LIKEKLKIMSSPPNPLSLPAAGRQLR